MKKATKLIALMLAVIMAVFAFAACGKDTDGKTIEDPSNKAASNESISGKQASGEKLSFSKKYVIYSDNSFAPFEYLDTATGKYTGFDMDLLAAIAEDQGFEYEMHNEGFDASMGAVQSGQADAMIAGMTITEDRQEKFDFSDGYIDNGQVLVVKADSSIKSLEDLKGKTVAVKASTQGRDYAESVKAKYGFETVTYEGSAEMYQAVLNGINDACFEDYPVISYSIKTGTALKTIGDVINPKPYGFAVKKGLNPELIAAFNAGLANVKANGVYDQILAKYGMK